MIWSKVKRTKTNELGLLRYKIKPKRIVNTCDVTRRKASIQFSEIGSSQPSHWIPSRGRVEPRGTTSRIVPFGDVVECCLHLVTIQKWIQETKCGKSLGDTSIVEESDDGLRRSSAVRYMMMTVSDIPRKQEQRLKYHQSRPFESC